MNVLLTNNTLEHPAGSELVVVELAAALQSRGHRVAAYSTHLGEVGERLKRMSVPAIRNPRACPFVPDVIHGQHHLDAMAALCAFPGVPAIYHCHGYVPWVETPPQHPRIHIYVGMAESISERIRIELGLPEDRVVTVTNWVDTDRFRVVRSAAAVPRRALIFHRSFERESFHGRQLRAAFARAGIRLDLDLPAGSQHSPEALLPDYDIVLAAGRSAIEAMASGCAVLPLSAFSCLDFVTPGNFEALRGKNFSPQLQSPQLCRRSVSDAIARYSAEDAAAVTALVRKECSLERATGRLEALYVAVIAAGLGETVTAGEPESEELLALSHYLRTLKPLVRDLDRLEREHALLQEKWAALQAHPLRRMLRGLKWLRK